MSDFNLLESALADYETNEPKLPLVSKKIEINSSVDSCPHENTMNDRGIFVCTDCGEEVIKSDSNKDWKKYGHSDTRHVSDPNRVQLRKIEEKSIFRDIENLGFNDVISTKANQLYAQVTQDQIFRGATRKAIIFACIFHAYKLSGKPQSHDTLIRIFNLNKKNGLKGLKYVNLYAPKHSPVRVTYIGPINLIDEIMVQFDASKESKEEVLKLYESIKNRSSKLNRSRPLSVAAGLVFYWILLKKRKVSLKEFAKKVELSDLTISKIAKEISEILKTPEIF